MDGFEVLSTIRERQINIPVIIISGRKEDFDTMYGLVYRRGTIISQSLSTPSRAGIENQALHEIKGLVESGGNCRKSFPVQHKHSAAVQKRRGDIPVFKRKRDDEAVYGQCQPRVSQECPI
jgi:CheY-like chemotaxis protein